MKLIHRNAVVIEFPGNGMPVVIGPFKNYGTACVRRDMIVEYLLDQHDLEDGTDYTINTVQCHATMTTIQEIERMFVP